MGRESVVKDKVALGWVVGFQRLSLRSVFARVRLFRFGSLSFVSLMSMPIFDRDKKLAWHHKIGEAPRRRKREDKNKVGRGKTRTKRDETSR